MSKVVVSRYPTPIYRSAFRANVQNHSAIFERLLGVFITSLFAAITLGAVWFGFMNPLALIAGLALIVSCGWMLAFVAAVPVLYPRRSQPRLTPIHFGIENWEEIHFNADDGVSLSAWFIPPAPAGDGATVIFVHGLGGNRGELLNEAALLVARGYGALLIDLRNHGRSRGSVTTLGYAEVDDVRGAVDYLLTRHEVNRERIGLFGYSMGATTVLRAAARIPRVRAIIAQSAYSSLRDNIAQGVAAKTGLPSFPFAPLMIWLGEHMTGLRIDQIRPIDDVEHIAPRAVLFIHGTQDATVDVSNSMKLYNAACEPKSLYLVKNASHSGLFFANPSEFDRRVADFLDHHLREIKPSAPIHSAV